MRVAIAILILIAGLSFGGAFWMVYEGSRNDWRPDHTEQEAAAARDKALAKPRADPEAKPPVQAPAPALPAPASNQATAPTPAPAAPPAPTAPAAAAAPPVARPDPVPSAATAQASPFPLALPIDCTPGQDCWVINYVDDDPGPDRLDYRCGQMSYDGHKGTDIALRNLARLADNVAVMAAAPGKVVGVRDGVTDISIRDGGREAVKGQECGNGVRIEHRDGWVTQYCHMKRGSIAVKAGQPVETGTRLGSVGLSGMTEFPHMHITVEKDRKVVDPFRGVDGGPKCGLGTTPLWGGKARALLDDPAPILLDAGFGTGPVNQGDAEAGTAGRDTAPSDAAALVVWTRAAGLNPGDVLSTAITGPDGGELFKERWTADRNQILQFRYVGKKRPAGGWPSGTYTGRVILERAGRPPKERTVTIRVGG